ncbi:MAG TPA: TetR/AcrR family transcriptional regulator, partial [Candidatus Methylacidiphilales bacterium]
LLIRGRPRSFDSDKALDLALQLFWRQGYERTSVSDLTRAMGINPPSLYAAFGNKEALFEKVLNRYVQGPGSYIKKALLEPTVHGFVQKLLSTSADFFTDSSHPCGCMSLNAGLAWGQESKKVRQQLVKRGAAREELFAQRLRQALAEGDLPEGSNPRELARYLSVIFQGLAVQAARGASRKDLQRVVDLFISSWPPKAPYSDHRSVPDRPKLLKTKSRKLPVFEAG